jgi:membrane-bound lytic murein transglycosylase D
MKPGHPEMRSRLIALALWFSILGAITFPAATFIANGAEDSSLDDVIKSAQEWANENLDESALQVLNEVDQERVKKLLANLQQELRGGDVLDLAQYEDTARAVLPLLESYEETLPYAIWLKTRLEYLEEAKRLRKATPPPKPDPGKPPPPPVNPAPDAERKIWVEKMVERPWPKNAKPYVSKLKPIFTAQKVPGELVWIAEVESSFDPRARSPVGAAGLFQLMPETARHYGLRTRFMDERLEPEPSAGAAAKHLRHLYLHYKDWRLAVAAYNAGEGTVDRLLAKQKQKSFDAIARKLPAETQMYVPRVEATILRREGKKLEVL